MEAKQINDFAFNRSVKKETWDFLMFLEVLINFVNIMENNLYNIIIILIYIKF